MNNLGLLTKSALVLAVLVGGFAVSAASEKSAACKSCQSADALAKELSQLDYKNDADKDNGGLKALEAVQKLENFEKLPANDPERTGLFKSLVRLSREAMPFDGESQLTQILASMSLKDPSLKKALDADVALMPRAAGSAAKCKTDFFESRLKESTCLKKAKVVGQQPMGQKQVAEAKSCTQNFDFLSCLKSAK